MNDEILRLTPHHINCIQHYSGRGYDDAFTERMNEISSLLLDGSTVIELVSGKDDVCGSCPNFRGGSCLSAEKIDKLDENWLHAAGLSLGERLTWDDICLATLPLFSRPDLFRKFCGGCVWYGFCTRVRTFASSAAARR